MSVKRYCCVIFTLVCSLPVWATTIHVPANQPTIQAGIDVAVSGDTVLVAPNIYYENIHFREKGIVVASHYILNNNLTYIDSTIINGSNPAHPDTASCVLIVSSDSATENDTSAALIGFTITGGAGTKWQDEHGAGLFREGGSILIQFLSPRIRNNIIVNNQATNTIGATSAGGGAIRCGDGNPRILNNIIVGNRALYGGGIVLNYTGAIIKNNIIAWDTAGNAYGAGGGVWAYSNGSFPKIIENNTIVFNETGNSTSLTGGVYVWATSCSLRNNIIWGNANNQIKGSAIVTYCDVEGGWTGEGNIDANPFFAEENFFLSDSSPCIDAGDTSAHYNDPADPDNPGFAEWPSMGRLRNDMGVYGGPGRTLLENIPGVLEAHTTKKSHHSFLLQNYPNPFKETTEISFQIRDMADRKTTSLRIYDVGGRLIKKFNLQSTITNLQSCVIWDGTDTYGQSVSSGVYIYQLRTGDEVIAKKMVLTR